MKAAVLALAALQPAISQPAMVGFHPTDGKTYHYAVSQTRVDGTTQRRFSAERQVTFYKVANGWRAEVVQQRTSHSAPDGVGSMFEAAMAGLQGKALSIDLDDQGAVLAIDNLAAIWSAAMDAVDRATQQAGGGRAASTRQITGPLRLLPVARQTAILASILTPLIDTGAAGRRPGTRTVQLPAASPLGTPLTLEGNEAVTITSDGTITVSTHADATTAPLIPPDAPGADIAPPAATTSATIRVEQLHRIDPQSGLVVFARDSAETCAAAPRRACVSTVTQLQVL